MTSFFYLLLAFLLCCNFLLYFSIGVSWCLSLFKSAKIPDLDTCLLNLLRADSIPSFSPTVTCVKISQIKVIITF